MTIVGMKKEEILIQLHDLKKAVGHHVHVHSSLKAVGALEGGGEMLLECLIEFFAREGGCVSFPTHTWDKNVLDMRKRETCTGMLGKLALQRDDGVRSRNTTHSMVLFGEGAKEYAKWDDTVESSTSPEGCYGKLYDEDGYVLLIGVGQEKNTCIHAAEERMNIANRITEKREDTLFIDEHGVATHKPMHLVFEEYGDISEFFGKLEPAFAFHNGITYGRIGNAKVQLCHVRTMFETLQKIHERSNYKEIFLDDKKLPREWYQGEPTPKS
ncbi:MAG: AAC(3) family N-acetyltransferase [Lachnospiraceae bacterium]|nr:AAC(3) family N-acetyltransferase [Lachnospiraceae bacterium]